MAIVTVEIEALPLGDARPTAMTLQLADCSYHHKACILVDVPVVVGNFAFPVDFVVLEMEDKSEPIILGRPFLASSYCKGCHRCER